MLESISQLAFIKFNEECKAYANKGADLNRGLAASRRNPPPTTEDFFKANTLKNLVLVRKFESVRDTNDVTVGIV